MKSKLLSILVLTLLILSVGCNKEESKVTIEELKKIRGEIQDNIIKYYDKYQNYNGLSSYGIDTKEIVIVVEFVENDEEHQKWFKDNICDSEYIKFKQGGPYTTSSNIRIEVVKNINQDGNKFNLYVDRNNKIYLSSNIEEVYYVKSDLMKYTLKEYITGMWQTTEDGMKNLTDILYNTETLRDGGTQIFKLKEYDITIVKCNTISGNRDYYIGDYNMTFDNESMCK